MDGRAVERLMFDVRAVSMFGLSFLRLQWSHGTTFTKVTVLGRSKRITKIVRSHRWTYERITQSKPTM